MPSPEPVTRPSKENIMPRIRIEATRSMEADAAPALMDTVAETVVATLALQSDDRSVSFTSFAPDMFRMKPPYCLFIEILLFSGRSSEVKKRLFRSIVAAIEEKHGIPADQVMIVLNEQPRENWGLRGGKGGDEIDFDYTITI